jgi:hypothetical protein
MLQRSPLRVEGNSGGLANAGSCFDQTPNCLVKRNLTRLFSNPAFAPRDDNHYTPLN